MLERLYIILLQRIILHFQERLFEALCDYKGDQPGDLSFKTGEVLTIIQTR